MPRRTSDPRIDMSSEISLRMAGSQFLRPRQAADVDGIATIERPRAIDRYRVKTPRKRTRVAPPHATDRP
ncbi:hypothetical protein BURMUCGD1_1708 [Burkholderia multivorans CGD1]|nr:hypothetical protein BURMUCGD1_1708 [Burkholderia multivorans CGD1]